MTTPLRIAIIGAGPGGLMLARLLQLRDIGVTVFERDSHAEERPQGGSLDLHAESGLRALRLAGLEQEFIAAARPEDQGDRLYDANGKLLFDHNGRNDGRPEIDRTALHGPASIAAEFPHTRGGPLGLEGRGYSAASGGRPAGSSTRHVRAI